MTDLTPLSNLQPNEKAVVSGFSIGCTPVYRQRLLTMGLLPNTVVELLRVAPLGDPIELMVRQSRLILRKNEASSILVERL